MEALDIDDGYLEIEWMETNNDGLRQKVTRLKYVSILVPNSEKNQGQRHIFSYVYVKPKEFIGFTQSGFYQCLLFISKKHHP